MNPTSAHAPSNVCHKTDTPPSRVCLYNGVPCRGDTSKRAPGRVDRTDRVVFKVEEVPEDAGEDFGWEEIHGRESGRSHSSGFERFRRYLGVLFNKWSSRLVLVAGKTCDGCEKRTLTPDSDAVSVWVHVHAAADTVSIERTSGVM